MDYILNDIKKKQILITGSSGLLGTALKTKFSEFGFCNILSPSKSELDLLNQKKCDLYFQKNAIEIVIHLAGYVLGLGGNLKNQILSFEKNSLINFNLISTIANYKVKKLFFAGTVASYPYSYLDAPLKEENFFDGLPHHGELGYALAKRNAYNHLVLLQKETNLEFTYGVLTNLFGKNDRFNEINGHVLPSLISKAFNAKKNNDVFKIWGNGLSKRDFMYSEDAANIIIETLFLKESLVLNIASGKSQKISDAVSIISDFFNIKKIEYEENKPFGISERSINTERLLQHIQLKNTPFEIALIETCEWYQKNYKNARR